MSSYDVFVSAPLTHDSINEFNDLLEAYTISFDIPDVDDNIFGSHIEQSAQQGIASVKERAVDNLTEALESSRRGLMCESGTNVWREQECDSHLGIPVGGVCENNWLDRVQ
jgi:hypothetical protein